MRKFAVFGNPIAHSKSPRIHQLFSEQTQRPLSYVTQLAEHELFQTALTTYLAEGAHGANITTPFKEQAYQLCHELTERARLAGAVNTVKKMENGQLVGDNTDGIGLVSDLERLGMLKAGNKVLLVGAGGAARGVILPLLESGCELVITNRTYAKAQQLAQQFADYGAISACEQENLAGNQFDLIVNATASGLQGQVPSIPSSLINKDTACYDMFYQASLTPFLAWAKANGAVNYADGLGMLVGQAAHAFFLWHDVMPDIESVLKQLRQELSQ